MRPTRSYLAALASLAATLSGCTDEPLPSAPRDIAPRDIAPRATVYASVAVGAPVVLGGLPGSIQDIPHGINDAGDVTGVSSFKAAVWHTGAGVVPSSTAASAIDDGAPGWGHDINAAGQVAGERGVRAALWTPNGNAPPILTDIGALLPGAPISSVAWGINDGGKVVGYFTLVENGESVSKCFLWTPAVANGTSGTVSVPAADFGGGFCVANAVNGAGTVVGASALPAPAGSPAESHAFAWDGSGGAALMDLTPGPDQHSYASGINDGGQVAGWRITSPGIGGVINAVVWSPTGAASWNVADLGTFGHEQSYAMDINDAGFVVGFTRDGSTDRAFFWQNGVVAELPAGSAPSVSTTALSNVVGNVVLVVGGSILDLDANTREPLRWAVTLTPASPHGCIVDLVAMVKQLRAGGTLRAGEAQSLLAKLDAATRQIDQGQKTPARNLLEAFINEVSAAVAAGRLSAAEAQPLIDGARCALAAL